MDAFDTIYCGEIYTKLFGLDWIGLDWTGLDWIGLDWNGIPGQLVPTNTTSSIEHMPRKQDPYHWT
jgi:hypothetical protein